MPENSDDLERLSREQLILKARVLGVERPELMTRVEMRDEIVRRSEPDLAQQKRARGFLGVARDLVASVVEAGLNLPDAAALIRGDNRENHWKGPPPVATVTLAEIYASQGHLERALRMLDEVLAKEPDHDPARALRTRLATATDLPVAPARRRQKISFVETAAATNAPDLERADAAEVAAVAEPASIAEPASVAEPASIAEPASVTSVAAEPEPAIVTSIALEFEAVIPNESESAPLTAVAPSSEPVAVASSALDSEVSPVHAVALEPASANAAVSEPAPAPAPSLPAAGPDSEAELPPPSLLTLALSGQRQIYWELPPASLAALRAHSPSGRPIVRVIAFRTRAGGVERQARDIAPDTEVGFAVLPNLRADAVVRAVLGWEAEGRFMPYLVASDLPSGNPSARQSGPFRANPLVGSLTHEVELRALSHCSQRPAH